MNQQEQTDKRDNHPNQEKITPVEQNYALQNQESEIVYIAELNGEFFTVDYNQEDDNPTVTPLKIVEFMGSNYSEHDSQLASVEQNTETEIKPFTESELPTTKPGKRGLSENKSLALGIGLGLLIAWGGTRLLNNNPGSEPVTSNGLTQIASSRQRSVTVAPVKAGIVDRNLEVSGTVEALELIPITAQTPGLQITEILVDEGAQVEKGQVLARLRNDTTQAEYLQAQAAVDGAKARLAELQAGTRTEEIAKAQERVKQAAAVLEQAKSDLELVSKRVERNRNLEAEGAISRDRLDEINNQERISRANLTQAEASLQEASQELKQLETGARPEEISQAKAELAQAEGQLQYAQVQLDNTIITAVTNGIVAERNVKVGDLTSASQTLFTIIEDAQLELHLQVPETDLNQISPQQKVTITSNQDNSQPIVGKVREIDPIVDSESRQATVKVSLPQDTNLQPGMFLEAAITTAKVPGITVPIKALLPQTENNAIAFVLQNNNKVEARSVKMGEILANNRIEVLEGLENGEQVVVKGAAYLKDGDVVAVDQ